MKLQQIVYLIFNVCLAEGSGKGILHGTAEFGFYGTHVLSSRISWMRGTHFALWPLAYDLSEQLRAGLVRQWIRAGRMDGECSLFAFYL